MKRSETGNEMEQIRKGLESFLDNIDIDQGNAGKIPVPGIADPEEAEFLDDEYGWSE